MSATPFLRSAEQLAAIFTLRLEDAQPSHVGILNCRLLLLQHAHFAAVLWSCLRAKLISREVARPEALWFILDAALHDSPTVYCPLVAPHLERLVCDVLPWKHLWAVPLVQQWAELYDARSKALAQTLRQVAVALGGAAAISRVMQVRDRASDDTAASSADLRRLESAFDLLAAALKYGAANKSSDSEKRSLAGGVKVKLETVKSESVAMPLPSLRAVGNTRDEAIDADDEYHPQYVAGAKMHSLASDSAGDLGAIAKSPAAVEQPISAPTVKREPRKRTRAANAVE